MWERETDRASAAYNATITGTCTITTGLSEAGIVLLNMPYNNSPIVPMMPVGFV